MGCLLLSVSCVIAGLACPSDARIDEIAAWLPVNPGITADPIDVRTYWSDYSNSEFGKRKIADAEILLDESIPAFTDDDYLEFHRTGLRYRAEKNYFKRIENLIALMEAECLENRGRFIGRIEEYLTCIAGMRAWTMPAHDRKLDVFEGRSFYIDLGAAHYAWAISSTLAVLKGRLGAEILDRMRRELQLRIFDTYVNQMRHPEKKILGWYYDRANWNAVCNGNVILSALAVIEDRRLRAEFVESGERTVPKYIAGFLSDGYCSEGVGYWDYGFSNYLRFALSIRQLTGGRLDFFKDRKQRAIVEYGYGIQLQPDAAPQFADGEGQPSKVNMALGRLAYPDLVPPVRSRIDVECGGWAIFAVRGFGQESPIAGPSPYETLPLRTWFDEAQVLISRNAPGHPAFGGATKGGNNYEMHNHNDVGSWQVMLNGVIVAGDPEPEIYTSRTFTKDRYLSKVLSSYGHPVPLADGKMQSVGEKFAAQVARVDFSEDVDLLELDLANAYESENIKSLRRVFKHDRANDTIIIGDHILLAEPGAFEVPIVTYMDVVAGYDVGNFELRSAGGDECVAVNVRAIGGSWHIVNELMDNPSRRSPKRIAVKFDEPVLDAKVVWTLSIPLKK